MCKPSSEVPKLNIRENLDAILYDDQGRATLKFRVFVSDPMWEDPTLPYFTHTPSLTREEWRKVAIWILEVLGGE